MALLELAVVTDRTVVMDLTEIMVLTVRMVLKGLLVVTVISLPAVSEGFQDMATEFLFISHVELRGYT